MKRLITSILVGLGTIWMAAAAKTVLQLSTPDQKSFIFRFVLLLLVLLLTFKSKRSKSQSHLQSKPHQDSISKSYVEIKEEHRSHLEQLKSCRYWTIGCLLIAWILMAGLRLMKEPQLFHPGFTTFIFSSALLLGIKDLKKQRALDQKIIDSTLLGVQSELKFTSEKPLYFTSFLRQFEGGFLIAYALSRITPTMLLLQSLLSFGILPLIHLKYPAWAEHRMLSLLLQGVLLGAMAVLFGQYIIFSYRNLMDQTKKLGYQNGK